MSELAARGFWRLDFDCFSNHSLPTFSQITTSRFELNRRSFTRASLMIEKNGSASIDRIGPKGFRVQFSDEEGNESQLFTVDDDKVCAFNRANSGEYLTAEEGFVYVAVVNSNVVSVTAHETGECVKVPLAGMVLRIIDSKEDDFFQFSKCIFFAPLGMNLMSAMAGGPLLVRDGSLCIDRTLEDFKLTAPPVTFSQDETFDQNLLPRMACGLRGFGVHQEIFFAAVDGRNFDHAPGFTLHRLAEFMVGLGCQTAMNLDGGSSKRMVINQKCVDLSSTEVVSEGSGGGGGDETKPLTRPVYSALIIE
mgnify:CR=1 FL=1